MENRLVTIYGYELTTPKFQGTNYDFGRFDFETFHFFFKNIIDTIPIKQRAFKNREKTKMINLISFEQSDDAFIWEGIFTTARYGKEQEILDVEEQTGAGTKPRNHGMKNEVHFTVDSRTGLLLVEKDSEQVAAGQMIRKFIRYHKDKIVEYQSAFNNQNDPIKIHKNNFLKIASLPNRTFFEEIGEFASIKEAYYYLDISETAATSNEVSNLLYLHNRAEENGMQDVTRVKISFENKIPKRSVTGVENYFRRLFEADYFDGLGVNGKLHSGRTKTIELENIQRAFDVDVEFNESGIPSLSDLINGMSRIALRDNPLGAKVYNAQYEGVIIDERDEENR
ncbi:hypothetical protein AUC31_01045 [Planococcus rifietoensis]|uniref:Uncharacterized protein n=1 Tax=Planococcus rifietoensis TaxID=200991 RepID=A0A0U2XD50_9BACL|nr:hypothetical protein [Planococcus rifietoensis]ALS73920.1 hypothetical protein AUC31_01045 [Planococcus rifietoensis]